jgi:hypothetical protein
MGDNGKLYIPEDEVPEYKGLLREADLILPNQFEAEWVSPETGKPSVTIANENIDYYLIPPLPTSNRWPLQSRSSTRHTKSHT